MERGVFADWSGLGRFGVNLGDFGRVNLDGFGGVVLGVFLGVILGDFGRVNLDGFGG